jgi:indolepyruvate ferredoxin oxidoreductase alpha subunit
VTYGYVAGYQGSPISHLMDVLADAQPILEDSACISNSASEATAAATLAASVNYPMRGAVTFKSTVGTNVAVRRAGQPGLGRRHRRRADHRRRGLRRRLQHHAGAQPRLRDEVADLAARPHAQPAGHRQGGDDGFALSEASHTPVMLELRIRSCHVHGSFVTKANVQAAFTLREALENPVRDTSRIVLPPASFQHEQEKISSAGRPPCASSSERGLNEFFDGDAERRRHHHAGRHVQHRAARAERLGLADVFGKLAAAAVRDERGLPAGRRRTAALLRRQEGRAGGRGRPAELHRAGHRHRAAPPPAPAHALHGKDCLPACGEYTAAEVLAGVRRFLQRYALLPPDAGAGAGRRHAVARPGAGPAAGLLHRLPGAPDLHRHEAGREGARRAPRLGRHRLPPVLDPAAVQPGQHHHGLRPGGGRRGLRR